MKKDKTILEVTKREILGKKLRKMRHHGQVPANIYGTKFESLSITINLKDLFKAYKVAKETGVVYLRIDGKEIPSLIKHIQKHPVTGNYLHVDFRAIDLKQKVEASVPVVTVNQSPAVSQKGGVLLTSADHIIVEALPEEIPSQIEIDLSQLTEIGQEFKVKNIPPSTAFKVIDEPEKLILSVIAHKEESVTPETEVAAPEVLTEKKDESGEESTGTDESQAAAPTSDKKEDKK